MKKTEGRKVAESMEQNCSRIQDQCGFRALNWKLNLTEVTWHLEKRASVEELPP